MSDLTGVTVAVLRVATDVDAIAAELTARGAAAPVVVVGTVQDRADGDLRSQVGDLARFSWVAVTSAHAARRLAALATAWPATTRVGAVGPATAGALERAGVRCDAVAPGGSAASLAEAVDGGPVLFLAASSARDDLPRALAARGIEVATVVAYDLVARALDGADVEVLARADALLALSPSAIDALYELGTAERRAVLSRPLVVIGPTTAERAAQRGLHVASRATGRDAADVADAVAAALRTEAPAARVRRDASR